MSAWTTSRFDAGSNQDWQQRLTESLQQGSAWSEAIQPLVTKLADGKSLSLEDGLTLYNHPNLSEVGRLAHEVRTARFDDKAFFNSNVHVNQTLSLIHI